jgi:hypothetical protein
MVVKNDLLGGSDWALGSRLYSADLNDTFDATVGLLVGGYRVAGLNLIRQLEDRSVTFSADGGEIADAYIGGATTATPTTSRNSFLDTYGRIDRVEMWEGVTQEVATNSLFDVDDKKWFPFMNFGETGVLTGTTDSGNSGMTSGDPQSPNNFFDGDDSTYAESTASTSTSATKDSWCGKIFASPIYVGGVYVKASMTQTAQQSTSEAHMFLKLQKRVSGSWVDVSTQLYIGGTSEHFFFPQHIVNDTIEGLRVYIRTRTTGSASANHTHRYYDIRFGDLGESFLVHTIPSGTFPNTLSSSIGVPKLIDWESGSDIQYKLTNATEDTGWLNTNKIQSFTAFTSEPTKCIVKLTPKSTSPTSGFPSISGFALLGDKNE